MNFFRHQEDARRNTAWLITLFTIAVGGVILVVNLMFIAFIAAGFSNTAAGVSNDPLNVYTLEHWLVVSGTTLSVILICSFFRQLSLRHGKDVANALGATLLDPGTPDLDEKRILNVVQEMALASGMPVPDVYVMEDSGINAFAAGYQPSDAVIGITRGALEALNRDQLQGVIAHEFSHIFNGDMRMNMRLTGILYGITFIAEIGYLLLHSTNRRSSSSSRDNPAAALFFLGLGLVIVGSVGTFFGKLIKAGVSRQREFLADASAVQFTRNPSGISDALKIIGYGAGSHISASAAHEMSHFFFGSISRFKPSSFSMMFATHPPIDERISRVEPGWDGHYLQPRQKPIMVPSFAADSGAEVSGFNDFGQVAYSTPESANETVLSELRGSEFLLGEVATANAHSAQALAFALLISGSDEATARRQQDQISIQHGQESFRETLRYLAEVRRSDKEVRLELIEKAVPALRRMSAKQYQVFHQTLVSLVQMDGKIELFEWCLYRILLQYLGSHFGTLPNISQKHKSAHAVADDIAVILSYVAHAGTPNDQAAGLAFEAAIMSENLLMRSRLPEHAHQHGLKPLNKALTALIASAPTVRERLIRAISVCIHHDGKVTPEERDLLRSIGAILEVPVGMFGDEQEALLS